MTRDAASHLTIEWSRVSLALATMRGSRGAKSRTGKHTHTNLSPRGYIQGLCFTISTTSSTHDRHDILCSTPEPIDLFSRRHALAATNCHFMQDACYRLYKPYVLHILYPVAESMEVIFEPENWAIENLDFTRQLPANLDPSKTPPCWLRISYRHTPAVAQTSCDTLYQRSAHAACSSSHH